MQRVLESGTPLWRSLTQTRNRIALCTKAADDRLYDVAVIGAGVVGVAVARAAAISGRSVVVLEQLNTVGAAAATAGNSGLGHTGYDAPVGSAERALLRRAITLHPSVMRSVGLRAEHVGGCPGGPGSLVVGWSEAELQSLESVLRENDKAGDDRAKWVSGDELRYMEPALNEGAIAAVHCPAEVVVEPFLIPVALAESATRHGAIIRLNTTVINATRIHADSSSDTSLNKVTLLQTCCTSDARERVTNVAARVVVNCGGLWGDKVESLLPKNSVDDADSETFKVIPRKGCFAIFEPPPGFDKASLPRHIIEQAPTDYSKGVIVWVNLHGHVVVGPTAHDQVSRTDREVSPAIEKALFEHGCRVFPALKYFNLIGTYSGLRPATEHRDYQLYADGESGWITVGGVRSTGLSAGVAIAEHTCQQIDALICGGSGSLPSPPSLGISSAAAAAAELGTDQPLRNAVDLEPIPSLEELSRNYRDRGDGTVLIWGRPWPVLHPQSALGFRRGRYFKAIH